MTFRLWPKVGMTLTKSFGNHPCCMSMGSLVTMASYFTRPHHHGPVSRFNISTKDPFSSDNSCGPPALNWYNTSAYTTPCWPSSSISSTWLDVRLSVSDPSSSSMCLMFSRLLIILFSHTITSRSDGWLNERLVLIDDAVDPFSPLLFDADLIDDDVETFAEFARLTFALGCGEKSWRWWNG